MSFLISYISGRTFFYFYYELNHPYDRQFSLIRFRSC